MVLYLIEAKCPHCRQITGFVEERVNPVQLMVEVPVSAEHCPECGIHLWSEGYEWDVQEEAEIERVQPTQERENQQRASR
jgi:hypothetical protein